MTTNNTVTDEVFVVEPAAASSGLAVHPNLRRHMLAGVALSPMSATYLTGVAGVLTSRKALLLTEDAAAARLVGEITSRTAGHDERAQRFARQLQTAAALERTSAPLLHRPDVRAALVEALAIGNALLEAVTATIVAARHEPICPPPQR